MTTPSPRLDGGHTPGPWQAGHRAWPEQIGCCPLIGRPFSVHRTDNYENVAAATTKANARLIAAAPDMLSTLAALEASMAAILESDLRRAGPAALIPEWLAEIRAAITRARGEP